MTIDRRRLADFLRRLASAAEEHLTDAVVHAPAVWAAYEEEAALYIEAAKSDYELAGLALFPEAWRLLVQVVRLHGRVEPDRRPGLRSAGLEFVAEARTDLRRLMKARAA